MAALSAIDRLRRISAHLRDSDHADHEFFRAALAQYEAGVRRDGASFDQALGLCPGSGATGWWEIEDCRKRDMLLRTIPPRYFPGANRRVAALAITVAVERYEAGAWLTHQDFISPPPELVGTLRGDLFELLKVGRRLSFKTIYAALRVCPEGVDLKAQTSRYAADRSKRGVACKL